MVGYNFQTLFEVQIRAGLKRQTVRADRKRHARPGEPVQLFCDQRSRHCRKLVSPDPICVAVRPIVIQINSLIGLASIAIEGIPLDRLEIELFATADGFAVREVGDLRKDQSGPATARANMAAFWIDRHGQGRFEGVLIQWEPAT